MCATILATSCLVSPTLEANAQHFFQETKQWAIDGLVYAEAYGNVGISASQCINDQIITYEPRIQTPNRAFFRETPDSVVSQHLSGQRFTIERVDVYHKISGGHGVATVRVMLPDGSDELRLLNLRASSDQIVSLDLLSYEIMLCHTGFHAWRIV